MTAQYPAARHPNLRPQWRHRSVGSTRADAHPPASTPLPVRLLARWDQPLLAYADRERIVPLEVQPLKLTLSGDATVTVDGRVAASWLLERSRHAVRVTVTPHVEIRRAARAEIRAEAERAARFCEPDAVAIDVAGV